MKKHFLILILLLVLISIRATAQTGGNAPPSVTLVWTPAPGETNFLLSWGTNSGNYFMQATTLTNTYTVTNLARGQTYYFAVQAVATNGLISAYSNEATYTVLAVPATPTGLRVIILSP
jgi:hypothetical protein